MKEPGYVIQERGSVDEEWITVWSSASNDEFGARDTYGWWTSKDELDGLVRIVRCVVVKEIDNANV